MKSTKKPLPDVKGRGIKTKKVPPQGENPAGATQKNGYRANSVVARQGK